MQSIYRDDRSFQLKKMYAQTRNTINIMTKATISSVKLASTMSNSWSVVSGERKWQYVWWHFSFSRPNEYVANAVPSKPYRMYDKYVIHRKYIGMASNDTKKPENNKNGTDITGAKNTPFCTFIAAPTTKPTLWATNEINKHAPKNMKYLTHSSGCDVK